MGLLVNETAWCVVLTALLSMLTLCVSSSGDSIAASDATNFPIHMSGAKSKIVHRVRGTTDGASSLAQNATAASDARYGGELPVCKVFYGEYDKRRYLGPHIMDIPVTYQKASMEKDLHNWIFANSGLFDVSEKELPKLGFLSDLNDEVYTDGEQLPHRYHEGYFHGLKSADTHRGSAHPRYGKRLLDKKAAPPRFRAFLAAFRERNPWLDQIMAGLSDEMRQRGKPSLAQMFSRPTEYAFSDIAVQVHFGERQEPIWHNDGLNSILHMAISMNGRRSLHTLLHKERPSRTVFEATGPGEPDFSKIDMTKVFVNELRPGDIYISSPTAFLHGVDYPTSSYSDRVIAVQCRLLMTKEEMMSMFDVGDDDWFRIIGSRVTPVLAHATVQMPTLSQVKDAFSNLPNQRRVRQEPNVLNQALLRRGRGNFHG